MNDNMDVLISRCATCAAESKWRLMGADSLAQATQAFKARIRPVNRRGGRAGALIQFQSFNRGGLSACQLRQPEKAFYYDPRETHYNCFGPRAWFDPTVQGRTSHHF